MFAWTKSRRDRLGVLNHLRTYKPVPDWLTWGRIRWLNRARLWALLAAVVLDVGLLTAGQFWPVWDSYDVGYFYAGLTVALVLFFVLGWALRPEYRRQVRETEQRLAEDGCLHDWT